MTKKYRLVCSNCHYAKEVAYEDLFDRDCPICQGELAYDMATETLKTESKDDFVDKIIITQMEKEIKALGNQKCYEVIERLAEARTRVRYLHYFLLAGGEVPKSDLIIEKNENLFINNKED